MCVCFVYMDKTVNKDDIRQIGGSQY